MAENKFPCSTPGGGREMVCIETNRILDSCRDRDCFEHTRVFLTDFGNELLERTGSIRVKRATICRTSIHIDPVQFNRGFYSVNIRFYVKLDFEACVGGGRSQDFDGIAVLDKRVILYGSESNVNIFKSNPDSSDYCGDLAPCDESRNVPIAVVEVVDPIVLDSRIVEKEHECHCCCCACDIPESVTCKLGGALCHRESERYLAVSLGIFSVVRIVRPAQYLIQATEYCVPDKECVEPCEDDPCAIFRHMAFPTAEFCPPGLSTSQTLSGGHGDRNRCGC